MVKIAAILRQIPKGAVTGAIFSVSVYLFDKQIIGLAELTLIANLAAAFGVSASMITRYYGTKR